MANKKFNTVDGLSVGGTTVIDVIDSNANITANAISATGTITGNNVYTSGTGGKHGYTWANTVSSAYTIFNSATISIDTVFG